MISSYSHREMFFITKLVLFQCLIYNCKNIYLQRQHVKYYSQFCLKHKEVIPVPGQWDPASYATSSKTFFSISQLLFVLIKSVCLLTSKLSWMPVSATCIIPFWWELLSNCNVRTVVCVTLGSNILRNKTEVI